jgi:5-methylthioadenosine/S-adenosylhomocysteine deaminase
MVTLWKASSGPPTSEWRIINAHNHVAYNFLPKWTPPKVYKNRGQWQRNTKNSRSLTNDLKPTLFCEMVKYREIKALLSGITTIQGTSPDTSCFRTLIRNAENENELGVSAGLIRTFILRHQEL